MSLKAGIVGLPNVGKSTLFSGLTKMEVESANYAFTTIDPNVSVVELNDERIDLLSSIVKTKKTVKATFEFVDIAGLVEGASKGDGLGNKFLSNIREVDLIVHVVRCFKNDDVLHVENSIDAVRDYEIINLELLLADLQTINNVKSRIAKRAINTGDKNLIKEMEIVTKLLNGFNKNIAARDLDLDEEELKIAKYYQLLTIKPMLVVGNVSANFAAEPLQELEFQKISKFIEKTKNEIIGLSVQIESEIGLLDSESKDLFLEEYGLKISGLDMLISLSFKWLNLCTYFTVGVQETRAWVFKKGMSAAQCAGIIHTDFEKNFIRAEVISYDDFIKYDGEKSAKENGKMSLEGKTYKIKDGDVCNFRIGK
ncbi:MAG: redox-regulated ATPase YchF [Mycoplasmataceae bacterium]|nr:redox-regulated ATPase YchF [Mycoplasmataceae bacterium]